MLKKLRHALRDVGHPKRSERWDELQRDFLRKNPQCLACGTRERLQVHHVRPFHLFPELELDESNLVVLCMYGDYDCHCDIGHGGSFRAWVPQVRYLAEQSRAAWARGDMNAIKTIRAAARSSRALGREPR